MLIIILLILAIICFILSAANVPRINWIALGMVFFALSFLLPLLGVHA